MSALLLNFRNTVIAGLILALVMIVSYGLHSPGGFDLILAQAVLRWVHVVCGVLWLGMLYYFNFVQMRKLPVIPADLKPALTLYITPEVRFWFRWSALATVLAGLALAHLRGYLLKTLSLGWVGGFQAGDFQYTLLGIGMWLAMIMAFNAWFVIQPRHKIALDAKADAAAKARAGRIGILISRTNMLLSLPMLTAMTMHQTLFG